MTTELALFDHAKEALAAAVRFDEVQSIRSAARQAEAYGKIARDRKMMADAQEIIARAERKLGIMLRRVKEQGLLSAGGRPSNSNLEEPETGADAEPFFDNTPFTLADIGVDKKLSSRAQSAAELADDEFEAAVQAKRDKTLSADAAVVGAPKPKKAPAAPKPEPVKALPAEKWHRFVFAVLALSMRSNRMSSEAVHLLAESQGIVVLDGDTVDFTPEAEAAMGPLAEVALRALEGDEEDQADAGRRLTAVTENSATDGETSPPAGADTGTSDDGIANHVESELAREVQGDPQQQCLTAGETAPLSTEEADVIIRAGYASEPPASVASLAVAIGRPGNKAYVRNRARVMKISDPENQRAAASAFATAQNAARYGGDA